MTSHDAREALQVLILDERSKVVRRRVVWRRQESNLTPADMALRRALRDVRARLATVRQRHRRARPGPMTIVTRCGRADVARLRHVTAPLPAGGGPNKARAPPLRRAGLTPIRGTRRRIVIALATEIKRRRQIYRVSGVLFFLWASDGRRGCATRPAGWRWRRCSSSARLSALIFGDRSPRTRSSSGLPPQTTRKSAPGP